MNKIIKSILIAVVVGFISTVISAALQLEPFTAGSIYGISSMMTYSILTK